MQYHRATTVMRLLALSALLVVAGVVGAYAAEAPSSRSGESARVEPGSVDVQYWMEDSGVRGSAVAIVSTTLDPTVKLPVVVQIPLPDGMTVEWAGEISTSGDVNDDIQRAFEIKKGRGGDFAQFELQTYRVGQIDLGAVPVTTTDGAVEAKFRYVQSAPASQTAFSVKVPAQASDVAIVPAPVGSPRTNSAGESLHTLPNRTMSTGQVQNVTVAYVVGDPQAAAAPGADGVDRLVWVLAGCAAFAMLGLLWVLARRRSTKARPDSPGVAGGDQTGGSASDSAVVGSEGSFARDDDPFRIDEQ